MYKNNISFKKVIKYGCVSMQQERFKINLQFDKREIKSRRDRSS